MKLTRGNCYFILDEDDYPIIAKVTKNTSYNNRPALHWAIYFREYPRSIEIMPKGRKEEYISNNWGDNYRVQQIEEWAIPYHMIRAIFNHLRGGKRVDFK